MANDYLVLKGGRLIDGSGKQPMENSVLVIKGDRVESVGAAAAIQYPKDAPLIDVSGATVMPGLIDAHIHLWGMKGNYIVTGVQAFEDSILQGIRGALDVWKLVDAGFTTVRHCGGILGIPLRNAVDEGSIIGPRILACGRSIGRTGGHADLLTLPLEWVHSPRNGISRLADGADEVLRAVREQMRAGADYIKMMASCPAMREGANWAEFTMEELRTAAEEAHSVGMRIAAHAQSTPGVKNAIRCGVDTVEHGFPLDDECINMLLKQKVILVTTLAIYYRWFTQGPAIGADPVKLSRAKERWETNVESFKRAFQAGVICGMGTDFLGDSMLAMGENALGLELYVEVAGMTPMQAIVCSTKNNAAALGLADRIGTLEAGKRADIIVVAKDPLQDIRVLRDKKNILHVFKAGAAVPRLGPIGVRGVES